ncbi:MAG: cupin domain-containing protein [Rhodocyclaceae bacterium]|nr:cupin domain-containing protein [Rhodocyclaceae bacterium]MCP5239025.1 cupin domain-containing protein [Zoogloeaceae bacterium]MCP5254087.1 cupin domain-containing protein [Zoogloeaceae bacterium]MCP5295262.1 cupin domain-containing protein [Zoogloeaceae bacterium]MCW5613677.1 cupin domain-containing protein [Rhodocyclaceae bacterium]
MNTSHFDRLSALLEGAAPRIGIHHAGALSSTSDFPARSGKALHLHLLLRGTMRIAWADGDAVLEGPAIAVLRDDCGHRIEVLPVCPEVTLLCVDAAFEGPAAALLLMAFASPRLIALGDEAHELMHVVPLIAAEMEQPRCGQPALLARAGDILFIGLMRYLVARGQSSRGVFGGLGDPRLARALVAMHRSPASPWSLESLADEAGLSRTAFATGFREHVGISPGAYLAALRLDIAERAVESGQGLKRAAQASGYASTAALSRALSRKRLKSPPSGAPAPRPPAA